MRRIVLPAILLTIVMLLSSCGHTEPEFNLEPVALPNPFFRDSSKIIEFDDVYYMLIDGYIYYIDKETMTGDILCFRPECSHYDENCEP